MWNVVYVYTKKEFEKKVVLFLKSINYKIINKDENIIPRIR